jgi:L-lysine 6-monooxygenase (NADPH-requiring)
MTTLLAGLGPAGRGVVSAMLATGVLSEVCEAGLVVVEPDLEPGGGALGGYNVRSDSAAIVFAECVKEVRHEPEVAASAALATILALPDGESIALSHVGRLLREATAPLVRRLRTQGADVRLGSRVRSVQPHAAGGASVTVTDGEGGSSILRVSRLVLALGGAPHVPAELTGPARGRIRHSDQLLRPAGLAQTLGGLPPSPRIVIVGRAHSAFSVADRLLSSDDAARWGPAAVTVATRGPVRVTYPDVAAARADGALVTADDVCPQSNRVWRLCGLRGDAAARYRLGRDGVDPRLAVEQLPAGVLARRIASADLVVAATGYRAAALDLLPAGSTARSDGSLVDPVGRALAGIRTIGLGSGSRRSALAGGEPSYTGPVDGVWHYQTAIAPAMLDGLFDEPGAMTLAALSG